MQSLIVVGGDGSLMTAQQLRNPASTDRRTEDDRQRSRSHRHHLRFRFCSECVMDALDRLHTTATSHRRVMVVEVMGRHAGWIALYGGFAGGGDIILIPEIPFDYDKVASGDQIAGSGRLPRHRGSRRRRREADPRRASATRRRGR